MPITITLLPGNVDGSGSNLLYAIGTLAFSGNYPTGGDTLDLRLRQRVRAAIARRVPGDDAKPARRQRHELRPPRRGERQVSPSRSLLYPRSSMKRWIFSGVERRRKTACSGEVNVFLNIRSMWNFGQ